MNKKAMYKLTYGLFLLTCQKDGKDYGCIINTCLQVSNEPNRISISVINKNFTADILKETDCFNVSVLSEEAPFALYKHFGMQSGRDVDKFEGYEKIARSENGLAYLTEGANGYLSAKIFEYKDLGSHTMIVADVTDGDVLGDAPSATYAYYQSKVKPKPAAPASDKKAWVCTVCGYVYEGDEVPDDFVCPLCKHGKEDFVPVEGKKPAAVPAAAPAPAASSEGGKKWVCTVCGYIYEGEDAPAECPVCHVGAAMFKEVVGELKLASEHEYGVYAKTVKNNDAISEEDKKYIFDQLVANFKGECSEVGMYLCMMRIAEREGYPEIGAYWKKAALEEAEHAAKFAELLGEDLEPNMKATTKDNLKWRVDCEFGATQGKTDLAMCAKKNGLDAVHDTVHEMARDEARHGKALKGMLERYFK